MHRLEIYISSGPFDKIFCGMGRLQSVYSIFPNEKYFSQFIDKFLKILENGIYQSLMLSLKCDHPFLCEFPIFFQH